MLKTYFIIKKKINNFLKKDILYIYLYFLTFLIFIVILVNKKKFYLVLTDILNYTILKDPVYLTLKRFGLIPNTNFFKNFYNYFLKLEPYVIFSNLLLFFILINLFIYIFIYIFLRSTLPRYRLDNLLDFF